MYQLEYRLALAYAVKLIRHTAGDVALLWNGNALVAIQTAPTVNTAETNLALPIVRLLRNQGERMGGFHISTTAPPTEACLGMARMCGIGAISYLASGQVNEVTCKRTGTTKVSYRTPDFGGPYPNVTGYQGKTAVNVNWASAPANFKDHLQNWAKAYSQNPGTKDTVEGKSAGSAGRMPMLGPGPISTFRSSGLEYLGLKSMVTDQTVLDNVLMMMTFDMVAQVCGYTTSDKGVTSVAVGGRSKSYAGQNIGSLLSDADGNIVGWGFNTNKENTTRHGETNLILNYIASNPGEPLPAGGTIYTTLEPCEMCSGVIARTVKTGDTFRVIYGQKDDNVFLTALQRKVNPGITMEGSKANLVTPEMIKSGTAAGATNSLVGSMKEAQRLKIETSQSFKATTKFLKEQSTYEWYFGSGRPNWWLYLWDYMTTKLVSSTRNNSLPLSNLLADPQVMKVNNQLDIVFQLVDQFIKQVKKQAVAS
jgi:tRNA(Arg) A34 adenosine deaminase TadA